jgi:hypothetical protein
VEEARQHPALTPEQRLFAAIYHIGSLALFVSCCLQIWRRIDALYPTIITVGLSRISLSVWQLLRPESSKTERTSQGLVSNMVVWASAIALLI